MPNYMECTKDKKLSCSDILINLKINISTLSFFKNKNGDFLRRICSVITIYFQKILNH